ncbi:MAG: hypothetical protein EOL91_10130 [Actinobacteria bacterium]|nr:hypothetical protein [Actinomycetota bacterium]
MSRRAFARRLTGITAVGALGLAMAAAGPALAAGQPATNPNTDGAATGDVDTGSVLVQLSKDPLATSTGAERSGNGKVDFNNSKTRNVRADLAKQRNELRQWLRKNAPKAKITGEYDVALNAVAIRLNGTPISVLQGGPGVVSVEYQGVYTPTTADEDPDLALINALAGWTEAGAATSQPSYPKDWAGAGIQVGVIDSGIDASHACFDGTNFDDGAEAVIVANNIPGDGPIVMAGSGTIPAVGVSYEDGQLLRGHDGEQIKFEAPTYRDNLPDNVLESFSSVGPTDVEFRVKPDVVAPGGNVLSSIPRSYCVDPEDDTLPESCWAFFSGTSMASPHLAGMAAVVLDAHSDENGGDGWDAWQVRSAIINTATVDGVMETGTIDVTETNVLKVGSGLAQLDNAVNATLLLSQPSISFGMVPSGSGKPLARTIEVFAADGTEATLGQPTVTPGSGFTATADGNTVTITFDAKSATPGFKQAHLWLDDTTHAVLFAFVK